MNKEYIIFLKQFIAKLKGIDENTIDENADVFEMNYLDSLNFFTLLVEIEVQFEIQLNTDNVADDRIRSIKGIALVMSEKKGV